MRHVRSSFACFAAVLVVLGCRAPLPPTVPPGAATAQLNDKLASEAIVSNGMFVVVSIDGVPILNATHLTLGMPWLAVREIEVRPTVAHIAYRQLGTFPPGWAIEGDVAFTPRASGVYRVNGDLTEGREAIWIEDFDTGQVVAPRITGKKR